VKVSRTVLKTSLFWRLDRLSLTIVYVHYTINQQKFKPSGELVVGVDKGYTEAFADSEGIWRELWQITLRLH